MNTDSGRIDRLDDKETSSRYDRLPKDADDRIEMVEAFTQLIASCKGKVLFRTMDGDVLVADSMLSALIGFKTLLDMADQIKLTFECEYPEDEARLHAFLAAHQIDYGRS